MSEKTLKLTAATQFEVSLCCSEFQDTESEIVGCTSCALLPNTETKKPDTSFICQLCSQPYKDPRMLSCLHSFCRECIYSKIYKLSDQQDASCTSCDMKCPSCTKTIAFPVGGVNDLPQDLHLDFETKCAQYQSKISQKIGIACDVCIDSSFGPALGFCCTCIQFLCKMCCGYHKHARHLHHHSIFALGKEVSKKELMETIKPSEPSCSLHDQNKLRFYCETCNCMICRDCTVVVHKDHKCVELSSIAKSCRSEIQGLLTTAQAVVPKLTRAIDGNVKVSEESEASEKDIAQAIKDTFLLLHKALDDRMNQLLGDLHSVTLSKTTALGLQRESFESLKQEVSHYSNFLTHVVQAYTDHEVMALKKLPLKELQVAIKQTENVSLIPCSTSKLQFILQTSVLIKEFLNLGHVNDSCLCPAKTKWIRKSLAIINTPYKLKVEALDSSGQKYLCGNLQVEAKIQSKAIIHKKSLPHQAVKGKVEDHRDGTYTITLIPLTTGPHQLIITVDGQNIKNIPYDLEVRHSKPNYRNIQCDEQFNTSNVRSPLCIAIHESGNVFIGSESNCVYVLDQNGVQKSVIGSKGNDPGQFNTPSGLAIREDVLYVADCNNHRIQKLTIGGDFITMFGKLGSANGEFNCPCALVVDCNNMLIIFDRGNRRIQVMNSDGTVISSIGRDQLGIQNIDGLAGLDPAGNILVMHSSTIDVISLNGTHVKTYTCGQYGATITGTTDYQGYILIVGAPSIIAVYDPHGNVFGTGHIASGLPKGVALNPNDGSAYIVVSGIGGIHSQFFYQGQYSQKDYSIVEQPVALLKYNF